MTVAVIFTWLVVSSLKQEQGRPFATIVVFTVILGLLTNMETYSFVTGTSLAVASLTCYALITRASRTRLIVTPPAIAVVLVLGALIAGVTGQLPLFGLLLLATVPANWPLIRENAKLGVIAVPVFAIAASPQVIRTPLGLVTSDDFLGYRPASTEELGIDISLALIAALPLLAITATLITAGCGKPRSSRAKIITASVAALASGVAVMSTNNL